MFLVVVALQPADFSVTRSAAIAAPADIVFAQVNELKKWEEIGDGSGNEEIVWRLSPTRD